jgi:hypothetical protein
MNRRGRRDITTKKTPETETPPGATRAAFDREANGGVTPGSPPGDRHAAGDAGGGTEIGGLAGSNIGDGEPFEDERPWEEEYGPENGPYAGHSGGAVGGTPAQGRAEGGNISGGVSPGSGETHGDSTIGAEPTPHNKPSRKRKRKA